MIFPKTEYGWNCVHLACVVPVELHTCARRIIADVKKDLLTPPMRTAKIVSDVDHASSDGPIWYRLHLAVLVSDEYTQGAYDTLQAGKDALEIQCSPLIDELTGRSVDLWFADALPPSPYRDEHS